MVTLWQMFGLLARSLVGPSLHMCNARYCIPTWPRLLPLVGTPLACNSMRELRYCGADALFASDEGSNLSCHLFLF